MNAWLGTRKRLYALACIALLLPLIGCVREPESVLRIGTNVWIGSEPLYLARELGHLNPKAVQLVEYPSASEVLRAFRNEAIDGMVISLDELFGLAVDGLQPRIILVVDVSNGADVVVGGPGMRTMNDLKGKRVAVESGALGAFVLSRALALNGMHAGDVKVVHLESNEQPSAFEKGQVDGAVTFDPYRTQLLRAGAKTLFDSTQIPGEIVDLLAVRATVLDKQPKAIQGLLAGWFGAVDYLTREPEDAARRMGIRQPTTGEQFLRALQGLRIPSHQVLLNLIINAQQSLQDQPTPRRIRVTSRFDAATDLVSVTVADNGPGIPAHLHARVFEPYFTTKPTGMGTGVGLAMSIGIVEAHGGTLTLDCPIEGGAVFAIALPVGRVDATDTDARPSDEAGACQRWILIVDDEAEIRETLAEILTGARHRVATVSSGREALERMAAEHYDVILTDIRMPDLDGRALFQEIQRRWPERAGRVVFVTGDTLASTLREFAAESGRPVIEKPFVPSEVRRVVAEML